MKFEKFASYLAVKPWAKQLEMLQTFFDGEYHGLNAIIGMRGGKDFILACAAAFQAHRICEHQWPSKPKAAWDNKPLELVGYINSEEREGVCELTAMLIKEHPVFDRYLSTFRFNKHSITGVTASGNTFKILFENGHKVEDNEVVLFSMINDPDWRDPNSSTKLEFTYKIVDKTRMFAPQFGQVIALGSLNREDCALAKRTLPSDDPERQGELNFVLPTWDINRKCGLMSLMEHFKLDFAKANRDYACNTFATLEQVLQLERDYATMTASSN